MHSKAKLDKDISVQDGDIINVGEVQMKVVHTPGHAPESICLLVDDALLTGDTLFVGECGRTDLPGGSSSDMYDSLFNKISRLDRNLKIYPGHNYGKTPFSTLGHEIDTNYTMKPRSREEFIRFMSEP
jgi:glyoxylase-like metal-dependent hydrolase (beta-lactamase superfamily II)